MFMYTRRRGSQRSSAPVAVSLEANWSGQGGTAELVLVSDQKYIVIVPENDEDCRQLQSHAAIIRHNMRKDIACVTKVQDIASGAENLSLREQVTQNCSLPKSGQ